MINLTHTVPSDRWGLPGSRLVYSAISCSGTPKMGWWYCFTWKLNAVPSWPCFLPQQSADPSFSTSSWWMELLDKFQRTPKEPRVTPLDRALQLQRWSVHHFISWSNCGKWQKPPLRFPTGKASWMLRWSCIFQSEAGLLITFFFTLTRGRKKAQGHCWCLRTQAAPAPQLLKIDEKLVALAT